MSKKIIISDIIGNKSGMHYYHEADIKRLSANNNVVDIFSNYHSNSKNIKKFYPNIFLGNFFIKIAKLIYAIAKFFILSIFNRRDNLIHYWYGTWIDVPFLLLALWNRKIIFDVHEIVYLDNNSSVLKNVIEILFRFSTNKFIVHSENNHLFLKNLKKNVEILPHPSLVIDSNIKKEELDEKHITFFEKSKQSGKKICLFFGDMRPSKGIHEVIEIIKSNTDECNSLPICGQDIFGLLDYNLNKTNLYLSLRRQTDSELRYLFLKSDIVLIPYKNSSQSGVLEVASNFKKPIAASHEIKSDRFV